MDHMRDAKLKPCILCGKHDLWWLAPRCPDCGRVFVWRSAFLLFGILIATSILPAVISVFVLAAIYLTGS